VSKAADGSMRVRATPLPPMADELRSLLGGVH
jgi:hypothetical protein